MSKKEWIIKKRKELIGKRTKKQIYEQIKNKAK